ncbi:MAG TPA: hypothetical protein VFH95_04420, partial [Candidatus Kapabacteria bacterium]|nr:hypothetical protein [Candidatus Kapabacteria bacterium]
MSTVIKLHGQSWSRINWFSQEKNMKRLILGSIILLSFSLRANNAFSETQDVLYIVSYNDTSEHVFFCNGVRQNYLNIELYLADISPTADGTFMLDSLILSGDTGDFQFDSTKFVDYSIGLGAAQGGFYVPRHPGMDTLRITGYYGNQSSSGVIILTSLESPDIALYGDINGMEVIDSGYGYEILTQLNYQLASDTLHDRFLPSEYLVSNQPQSHQFNNAVTIKSCGGATLISIDTVGDFSEITLDSIPALPYTIHGDSDLVMPYTFIPHVVGNTHHYLRFHFDDGKILVWSFEYQV